MAIQDITLPDIGGATKVDVIDVAVVVGDTVKKDDTILTLEGDKATMEIPAPVSGVLKEILVKRGDKVSQGHLIARIETSGEDSAKLTSAAPKKKPTAAPISVSSTAATALTPQEPIVPASGSASSITVYTALYASPTVRRIAREFGIDLTKVPGSGGKGRITKEDIQQYVQHRLSETSSAALPKAPVVDFARFGRVEAKPLNKIKRATANNLHRSWLLVPHVTQFEEADITALEEFRQQEKSKAETRGFKLTLLVFIMKAVTACLKAYPHFNASLDATGENLIYKHYVHLGVAVETPKGLVVPVIRNVDEKGIFELAKELGDVSEKARTKGLSLDDMQGGCFTISSLGGIGGTAFTPIVNTPEVAILGISRSQRKPIFSVEKGAFEPRLILPLSLSYDHRVIDGADGARFVTMLAKLLTDIRQILL